jgi:dTDP-4-dehydrorhamnose reductase
MRHVAILGANGQLGTDLRAALCELRVTGLTHAELDVCNTVRARELIGTLRPDVVINTTAFHKVDICEDEPAMSFAVNASAVYELARLARDLGSTLIHFSSDYVFDGRARSPYSEEALPGPINVYGVSKLAGEHLVRRFCPHHYVIRTTGLYGVAGTSGKGGNFVETMIRLGRSGNPVRVVADQVVTPTATADLAAAVAALVEKDGQVPYGLYHVTSRGQCSWYEFARAIFERCAMPVDLTPITTAESGAKATRPAYSVLDHRHWIRAGLQELRPWHEALDDYLRAKQHIFH